MQLNTTPASRETSRLVSKSTIKAHAYTPPDAARGASKPQSHSDQKRRLELLKNI